MAKTVDCLYTTVMNTSGREAVFSFLPPHGKTMAINEQLTIAGNIIDRLASKTSNRNFKALERALLGGALAIISTPSVIVSDEAVMPTLPKGKAIEAPAGALGVVDPCWVGP